MVSLWTPPSYGTPNQRIRQNPDGLAPLPFVPDDADLGPTGDFMIMPDGTFAGAAEDAMAKLQAAGPRGVALLGAATGLVFSGWKAAVAGGVLGYFAGKFLSNFAGKALAVVASSAAKVAT